MMRVRGIAIAVIAALTVALGGTLAVSRPAAAASACFP
jgi:hypothetical protein